MLPNPLHPAVVHFPVVLAVLLPIFAIGALWAIRRGADRTRAWSVPLALAFALAVSALVSVRTGEAQEDRVERVVPRAAFHSHEEAGEALMVSGAILLLVVGAGLVPGRLGHGLRLVAALGSVVLAGAAAYTAHTGGQLVYRYGAASAYASPSLRVESAAGTVEPRGGDDRDR